MDYSLNMFYSFINQYLYSVKLSYMEDCLCEIDWVTAINNTISSWENPLVSKENRIVLTYNFINAVPICLCSYCFRNLVLHMKHLSLVKKRGLKEGILSKKISNKSFFAKTKIGTLPSHLYPAGRIGMYFSSLYTDALASYESLEDLLRILKEEYTWKNSFHPGSRSIANICADETLKTNPDTFLISV